MATDISAEARRQAAEAVQGEVCLFTYTRGWRKSIATLRFDPAALDSNRYRPEFVKALRAIARAGEPMAIFHLRMGGMSQKEIDVLVERSRRRREGYVPPSRPHP